MKGFEGKDFSSWVKVNPNQGKLDYFLENPDKPRQNARQSENTTTAQTARQDSQKQSEGDINKQEKAKGFSKKIKV